ncbi:hypothetical protein IQ249_11120 [Lusitaniella coriacea LEGE 07157]|uniref:Uncharacterized protein n=1 Tax=Lusitaniella coriacea LEGE 07157 TaxID=945747 RepID=A0A8J7DX02_9CYAN|nr:hypothetical protein [Lusitaniella coriacea]MBE9116450.1 hypothetical protein [Lusitaniella coriacea LEGE 07157]
MGLTTDHLKRWYKPKLTRGSRVLSTDIFGFQQNAFIIGANGSSVTLRVDPDRTVRKGEHKNRTIARS